MKPEHDNKKHRDLFFLKIGLTAFFTIAAAILFYFILYRIDGLFDFFGKIIAILQPVFLGFAIAYILNPIVNFFSKYISRFFVRISKKANRCYKLSLGIAITASMLLFLLFVFILFYMIIPELVNSISSLLSALPQQIKMLTDKITGFLSSDGKIAIFIKDFISSQNNWLQNIISGNFSGIATGVANGVLGTFNFVKDIFVGLIVAIYILISKATFKAQSKKVLYALIDERKINIILKAIRKINDIFSNYILGSLTVSLVVGIICFIVLSILNIPYTMLISVIVGVTNMIPVFGPYIGGAISTFLIVLHDPLKCLYFIIFIVLMQSIEGNIISPKILGDSIGLPAFWVIVAILLGGGLFGILGVLLGVPAFAALYYFIKVFICRALNKKKLPYDTAQYKSGINLNVSEEENAKKSTTETE